MLIIYRLSDGAILDNSGTNSAAPLGLPADDGDAWRLNLRSRGVLLKDVGFLRLHDLDQAALVARTFTEFHHVDPATGALVFDGPIPEPEPVPVEPTPAELIRAEMTTRLATIEAQLAIVPAWTQPFGAHDAYAPGAVVTHQGQRWTSDVDANVWEPGVYGWSAG